MKLVVKEILDTGNPYKPEGKNYTKYEWIVSGSIDGNEQKFITVVSFAQIELKSGSEYEVDESEWKGKKTYTIKTSSKGFQKSNWSKPVYSLEEYDALFNHAFKFITSKVKEQELANPLISTYIISAIQSSVKIKKEETGITGKDIKLYDDAAKKIQSLIDDKILSELDFRMKLNQYGIEKINQLEPEQLLIFMTDLQ